MENKNMLNIISVIDYIETNLSKKLDLETIANAVHYSKYHLHRMFHDMMNMTLHHYIKRRKLTESAKYLVFSDKSIIDISLATGYESQQAFTLAFKEMYKETPNQYRENKEFYPLQLRFVLHNNLAKKEIDWKEKIRFATHKDILKWMELVRLVVDAFPHLEEDKYRKELLQCINKNEAFLIADGDIAIGAMMIDIGTGHIDFLAIHPQYRNYSITKIFLHKIWNEFLQSSVLSITTFRDGDKADTGYRKLLKNIGFMEAELLVEFGYPTQRFQLHRECGGNKNV